MGMLSGKVAFVTGGGSGIGRGIAERLAREGADVSIGEIDLAGAEETAELVRQAGRQAHVVKMNVAAAQHVQEAVESCVSALGRLDIAVANAGIARASTLLEMNLKDWQDQVDVNLTGVFVTAQAAARKMVELGNGGRIICLSSLAAERTRARMWSYSATKAGVRMMVRGWAQELGPHGITVNAIGPGIIETPLARPLAGDEGGAIRQRVETLTPVGRVGQPSDIAGLAAFLCGPDAAFMTGSYLIMDGGLADARPAPDRESPFWAETERYILDAQQRRERMQPWIDER
ncbi:SDR family NAD(P)-dependent oxidoreductase [Candidatus Entotheonella palauensis]|uniref:SDR family NAD(P)-dependent oxidoreductase n=1 Tax=Candidatus Entotheonella palauensis TaxID=93172 RepID=UPI0015C44A9E|nr:SDR family NAD(P)-dependent oxidoreductase [Candidatus Entotheonella palauensis]